MAEPSLARINDVLAAHALELPPPWQVPSMPGTSIPASLARLVGPRLFLSGHVPTDIDGRVTGPFGKVGAEVSLPQAEQAAVRALLSLLASARQAVGDLTRVAAWCRLNCMVNSAPGFTDLPAVFNPASQLLIDLFGPESGRHARVAVGVAGLPWNLPVEIEAELVLTDAVGE
jgi:enamine deaminase RidA (YjgF/YER057c/UK114 family)